MRREGKLDVADEEIELDAEYSSRYRAIIARALYLSQDRTDIIYAVKELSRFQKHPTARDWQQLKRLARYLINKERSVMKYEYQDRCEDINVWTDTDYAGCKRTRKSTSGGIITFGNHVIKSWSVTQSVIALSSGEAEYYGMVRGGSIGLGMKSMLKELGVNTRVRIKTDASAAIGIASRKGL